MRTNGANEGGKWNRYLLSGLVLLALAGLTTTAYYVYTDTELVSQVNMGKLDNERLLAEKLQLDRSIHELNDRLQIEQNEHDASKGQVNDLKRKVEEALARNNRLESAARRTNDLTKEVKQLRALKDRLEGELAASSSSQLELQGQLDKSRAEQAALSAQLAAVPPALRPLDNSEVEAVRGRRGRLTVRARATREVRMAFDLPAEQAQAATFVITDPSGHTYAGADPSISMSVDEVEPEPLAAVNMTPQGEARVSRVHMKFSPPKKLVPGTYRIAVKSGGDDLGAIRLNLR